MPEIHLEQSKFTLVFSDHLLKTKKNNKKLNKMKIQDIFNKMR